MTVERLREGLWRWTLAHPQWLEGDAWDPRVGSVYCETPAAVVLIDPLLPIDADDRSRFWRALDADVERLALPVVVLLTCGRHVRSAAQIVERYGGRVVAPSADGRDVSAMAPQIAADGEWPVAGVQAFASGMPAPHDELVYWLPAHRALVAGDAVLADGRGGLLLAPSGQHAAPDAGPHLHEDALRGALARLVELDPDLLLPAHGDPVRAGAAALLAGALARLPTTG